MQATIRKWHLNELPPKQMSTCIFNKSMDVTVELQSEGNMLYKAAFIRFCFLVITFFDCYILGAKIIHLSCPLYLFF